MTTLRGIEHGTTACMQTDDDGAVAYMPRVQKSRAHVRAMLVGQRKPAGKWDDLAVTWGAVCAIEEALRRWWEWEQTQ